MIWLASTIFVVIAIGVALYVVGVGIGSFFVMLEEGMRPLSAQEYEYRKAKHKTENREMMWMHLYFYAFCAVVAIILGLLHHFEIFH